VSDRVMDELRRRLADAPDKPAAIMDAFRVPADFGAEPHGEDAAVMAAHEPSLGRYWPESRDKVNAAVAGAALREFCDAFGIPVPADTKRTVRAFARLVEASRR